MKEQCAYTLLFCAEHHLPLFLRCISKFTPDTASLDMVWIIRNPATFSNLKYQRITLSDFVSGSLLVVQGVTVHAGN